MIALRLPLFLLGAVCAGVLPCPADEFDSLRLKWRDTLTLGTNANKADPNYTAWISSIGSKAQSYLSSMNTNPNRTSLWTNFSHLATQSSDITSTYGRLRAMALGYTVHGSSLEGNAGLRTSLLSGLDWIYTNYYNETITTEYDNWFDWEIATPLNLNDTTVLMYDKLTAAQISNFMNAVANFAPTPNTILSGSSPATAANKVWKASVVAVRGAVVKNAAQLTAAQQALSDVFPYVTAGDGFYADGSFVFHSNPQNIGGVPYNTGYGVQLLGTIGPLMQLLSGSSWQVTDPAQTNVFRWVYDSYAPFIYRGASLQMASGRYFSRDGDDHLDGADLLAAILGLAQFAPPADAAAYKSLVKYWMQTDTYQDFIQTQPPPVNVWAKAVVNDPTILPATEPVQHRQFPGMDRVVHLRPGWGFALAMSSSRIGNYESINGENLHGWYTGDGMTYLYNSDLGQFADNFWSTVDPYRLPGTTIDTQSRTNGSGEGYVSPNNSVGGASLNGLYGLAGMQVNAWNSSLAVRKSWFMFDDEVVCLGAGITATNNRAVETVVENRRLSIYGDNTFLANGTAQAESVGSAETITNASWAHLAGNVPGADLGYFFPQPITLQALREARAGAFADINPTYGDPTRTTRNYLTLWFNHGINPSNANYAYVLLPNQSASQVATYAANPDIAVLVNNTRAQGVKEATLGITAVNFWKDTNSVGGLTVDKASSVIIRNDGTFLDLGISDPTQTNTAPINLEITNAAAAATLASDPNITVMQLTPSIKLAFNPSGALGRSAHARFFVGPAPTVSLLPAADAYVENGTNANANFGTNATLVVKTNSSTSNLSREFYLRFALPPAPGTIFSATLRLVPVTPYAQGTVLHSLAPVANNSWTENGLTWNTRPGSGAEVARWQVPQTNTPVLVPVTALAQQAAAGDGYLSLRIYTVGTNTTFTAYGSKENNTAANRPQLIVNFGRTPPSIALTSPADGSMLDAPGAVTLTADAQDPDGAVTNVSFYNGGTWIAQVVSPPYSLALSNLAAGFYSFTAAATDNSGLSSTSAPASCTVYSPEPAGVGTGVIGQYCTNLNFVGLVANRTDPTINFIWGPASPLSSLPAERFSVRWIGKLQAQHAGLHLFHTVTDEGTRLWIGDQLVVDDWGPHPTNEAMGAVSLVPGQYYDLRMEYYDLTNGATAQLYWTPPGGTKQIIPQSQLYPAAPGLLGAYSSGANKTNYLFTRLDETVNFAWGGSTPDPVVLPGAFSARWTGRVRANQGGVYMFYTLSAGAVRLSVNNQFIISNYTEHAATENSGNITLAAGQTYQLALDFYNSIGGAAVSLMWAPPGEPKQVLPEGNLTPVKDNNPPTLDPLRNTATAPGRPLSFTANASDPDQPFQSLSYSLDPGSPAGASINSSNGVFTWSPPANQALGNYPVTVRVSDNGSPIMTDAQMFSILVSTTQTASGVTFVPSAATWRYLDNGTDPGPGWRNNSFNDSAWKSGPAPLGYGNGHEATLVSFGPDASNKPITTYFRRTFFVPDPSLVQSLLAHLWRDDGAVVYLNGVEVWRDNLPSGTIANGTLALTGIDSATATNFLARTLDPAGLVYGSNVLAVEIHLDSPAGPDIALDAVLSGVAVVPTQTRLAVTNSGNGWVLSWPQAAGLLQLCTTTNLSPTVPWSRVPATPSLSNGQLFTPLNAPTNGSRFYRLQSP